jgi:hypothetical protein
MVAKYSREELLTPIGLMSALQNLFPDFPDADLVGRVDTGEANLHTVMMEFCGSFDAARSKESQLAGLANLMRQCISTPDDLENAAGTCFLEALGPRDAFWRHLPADIKSYIRAGCVTPTKG